MLKNRRYIRVVVYTSGWLGWNWFRWAADVAWMVVAFAVAVALRFEDLDAQNPAYFDYYVQMGLVQALVWGLLARGPMHAWEPGWGWKETALPLLRNLGVHIALTALLLVALKFTLFSRWFWLLHFSLFVFLACVWRAFALAQLRRKWRDAAQARPIWLVGHSPAAERFLRGLGSRPDWALRVERHWGDDALADFEALSDASWDPVDRPYAVYAALPGGHPDIPKILRWADSQGIRFRYLPDLGDWGSRRAELHTEQGFPWVQLRSEPLANPIHRWSKRLLDVLVSALVLVLFGWWVLPLTALFLQLASPGPVFFKQVRHGYGGRSFVLWKLRTMRPNDEADQQEAQPNDPRLTRVGAAVRRLALDEFPQFFQVLWGTLSLVGPRPHMVSQTPEFQQRVAQYPVRHWVKPGLTGLAQVRGFRGDSSDQERLDRRIEADVYYVENASLLLDVQILAETAWWWITGRGGAKTLPRNRK